MKLRLISRIQVGVTAALFWAVGILLWFGIDRYPTISHQESLWPSIFMLSGALCLWGWFDPSYRAARCGMVLAASSAVGFACILAAHLLTGQPQFLLGVCLWAYIAFTAGSVALQRDPWVYARLSLEIDSLQNQVKMARHVD